MQTSYTGLFFGYAAETSFVPVLKVRPSMLSVVPSERKYVELSDVTRTIPEGAVMTRPPGVAVSEPEAGSWASDRPSAASDHAEGMHSAAPAI